MIKIFKIAPHSKPRMTRSDKWKKRNVVVSYWKFKDEIVLTRNGYSIPENNIHIIFGIPIPKSYSKKKQAELLYKKHQKRPDVDNLTKAIFDALETEDSYIWDVRQTKLWSPEGRIIIIGGNNGILDKSIDKISFNLLNASRSRNWDYLANNKIHK